MRRRTLLKLISGWLGAACAAIVGVPGVSFILGTLRKDGCAGAVTRRITRLKDLPIGKPVAVPILGARQDAWTVHPDEVLGRVWLVRRATEGDDQVAAFTAICPHLGCMIQHDAKENHFICPCHRATFGLDGEKLVSQKRGSPNHAPRGMDSLECQLVKDDETNELWVEVTYQKFEQGLTKKVCKT